ncbi:MAG: polysaccharide deacetylase family protein [Acutalibacteraceae bacterium]|nr:polysaccharide deacetylase family protein [Acutalibacteraceae bacterium]
MVIRIKKSIAVFCVALICVLLLISVGINAVPVLSVQGVKRLPVVMYHQLTTDKSKAGKYVLTVEQFEKDLIYLKENGYSSITLAQLFDYSEGKGSMPEKPVMITFDDGCETVYTYALPLLEKYGFTAVCFIIGSVTDKYSVINDHNLAYSNLNWDEVREMCNGGIIEIQSHTYDLHENKNGRNGIKKLKSETFEQYNEFLMADALKMKEKMIENTGNSPVAAAYPFGSFSKESADILKNCGIKATFTCEEKVNIIKKAESDWLFGLGRYNRPEGISSESFFKKWE